jgi:hypothetical protein
MAKADGAFSIERGEIVFGRTELGQALYDVLMSGMSATEAARRHRGVSRKFVLEMRRKYPEMRPVYRRPSGSKRSKSDPTFAKSSPYKTASGRIGQKGRKTR